MHDDLTRIHIPSTIIHRTSVLDFLPGQIAAALLAAGRYGRDGEEQMLAMHTLDICDAILERLRESPNWKPVVVIMPKEEGS